MEPQLRGLRSAMTQHDSGLEVEALSVPRRVQTRSQQTLRDGLRADARKRDLRAKGGITGGRLDVPR